MHFADVLWMLAVSILESSGHVQDEAAHECVGTNLRSRITVVLNFV